MGQQKTTSTSTTKQGPSASQEVQPVVIVVGFFLILGGLFIGWKVKSAWSQGKYGAKLSSNDSLHQLYHSRGNVAATPVTDVPADGYPLSEDNRSVVQDKSAPTKCSAVPFANADRTTDAPGAGLSPGYRRRAGKKPGRSATVMPKHKAQETLHVNIRKTRCSQGEMKSLHSDMEDYGNFNEINTNPPSSKPQNSFYGNIGQLTDKRKTAEVRSALVPLRELKNIYSLSTSDLGASIPPHDATYQNLPDVAQDRRQKITMDDDIMYADLDFSDDQIAADQRVNRKESPVLYADIRKSN